MRIIPADIEKASRGAPIGNSLVFPVGRTPDCRDITGDFARTPHILVGGCTGSGKSNFLHSLIRSLVERHAPEELLLVLMDAKLIEFGDYARLPNLLRPIVHDTSEAIAAFRAVEQELVLRMESFAAANCAGIDNWNARCDRQKIPFIVVVADEFSDCMCADGAAVEPLVRRIARNGAKAGIHLVLSTSRIVGKIYTDGILADFPGRMAFRTAYACDALRFIGMLEATDLKGCGDALWREPSGELLRVQTTPSFPWPPPSPTAPSTRPLSATPCRRGDGCGLRLATSKTCNPAFLFSRNLP